MGNQASPSSRRVISIFTLAMINVAAIASLKNLPMMAEYGLTLVFYFAIADLPFQEAGLGGGGMSHKQNRIFQAGRTWT